MKHSLPDLESLKVFESAARHLSFSKAAQELCITKGAVSYQIKKLESELSTRLFKRGVRQVLLTDQGQRLYQDIHGLFSDLQGSLASLAASIDSTITIAVTTYVATRWLSPRITEFCERHPHTTVQFVHTVNSDSFDINDVDIAIRWGPSGMSEYPNRVHEFPSPLFVVGSPALLDNHVNAVEKGDWSGLALLCEDRPQDLWEEWSRDPDRLQHCVRRTIGDANVRVQAAVDGIGLVLADDMMQFEMDAGLLARIDRHDLHGYGYAVLQNPLSRHRGPVQELLAEIIR